MKTGFWAVYSEGFLNFLVNIKKSFVRLYRAVKEYCLNKPTVKMGDILSWYEIEVKEIYFDWNYGEWYINKHIPWSNEHFARRVKTEFNSSSPRPSHITV